MLNQTEDTEVWDSVKTFISGHEGNVVSEHSWGTRRLAYPIQKGQQKYLEGTYHLSRFETESPFNKELENHLRLDERVLRSLILSITEEEAKNRLVDAKTLHHESVGSYEFTTLINNQLSYEEKTQIIQTLWQISNSDQHIDQWEEHAIRKIADLLYIDHQDFIDTKIKTKQEKD